MSNDTKRAARGRSSRRTHDRPDRASVAASDTQGERPSIEERIRFRAYELYLERGAQPNDDLADWLRAERELGGGSAGDVPEAEAS